MFVSRLLSFGKAVVGRPAWASVWRPVVGVAALMFLMADDGIGSDELACEIAVTHLSRCCPGLLVEAISCVRGGCDSALLPDLDEGRAGCMQARSCEELKNQGACNTDLWELHPSCLPAGAVNPICQIKVPPCR